MANKTSIEWKGGRVRYIDQTRLPLEEVFIETSDYRVVAESIRNLEIRGAPAIGVAAAFALALAVAPDDDTDSGQRFDSAVECLSRTRPTAVNLFASLKRMRHAFESAVRSGRDVPEALREEALSIQREDAEACRKIAENGLSLLPAGSSVLTHCHTGALATAGGGTALNIIIEASRMGLVRTVYVDETRPLLQGARLTAWELLQHGIDPILITDSTAGFLMKQRKIDAVLVGADRIAMNGDTANKIGTYSLAVLAGYHDVPFYVAAPVSTIDRNTGTGNEIPVEERDPKEITHILGKRAAPEGVSVFAPAFDVTPNNLITAIVTDTGIARQPFGETVPLLQGEPSGIQADHDR